MKIKVCGITRAEDVQLAVDLGAWAIGLNFYKESPRFLELVAARQLSSHIRRGIEIVGVFVDAPADEIIDHYKEVGLTMVQLHGSESPEFCEALKIPYIKALRPQSAKDLEGVEGFKSARGFLIDAYSEKEKGGTGELANWDLAVSAKKKGRVLLAGGLTEENVAEAVAKVRPFAIDVASGVEKSPGIKDSWKMRTFFKNANEA